MVPIDEHLDKTFEDDTVTSYEDRKLIFGDKMHVRLYGKDFPERLLRCGFAVEYDDYTRRIGKDEIRKYGLVEKEIIYCCTKSH